MPLTLLDPLQHGRMTIWRANHRPRAKDVENSQAWHGNPVVASPGWTGGRDSIAHAGRPRHGLTAGLVCA